MQDEQDANDAVIGVINRRAGSARLPGAAAEKKRTPVWWIIALVAVVFDRRRDPIYRADLKASVDALLLKNLRQEGLDMTASIADGAWRRDAANGHAPVPPQADENCIPLHRGQRRAANHYYDGSIYLETAAPTATRPVHGLFHARRASAELYNATDGPYARESGEGSIP